MKNTGKIIVAFLMCLAMIFTIVPINGFVIDAQAVTYSKGDILEYGSYPQTRVKDKSLISKLNGLSKKWISYKNYSGTGNWSDGKMKSGDFMKYADVTYKGVKYRGVTFSKYLPWYTSLTSSKENSYQDDSGYSVNTTYWFKYEPLKWRVIDPTGGLVLSVKVIDGRAYNNTIYYKKESYQNTSCTTYANNYAKSSIRKWLNGSFYNTAFTGTERSNIVTTALNNNATASKYNSPATKDKVFMLSKAEASNKEYGFSTNYSTPDKVRKAKATDYSKCQGIYVHSEGADKGNSSWWLRTPGSHSSLATGVYSKGDMSYDYDVNYIIGIRPAIVLKHIANNRKDLSKKTTVLSSVTNTVNGPQLKWKKEICASGYYVYRKTSGTAWERIGTTTSTSYVDKTAKSGTTYIYTAKAYNVVSTSKFQSGLTIRYLAAPKITSLQNSVTGSYMKWNKVAAASGYQVYRKTGANGKWAKIATVKTTDYKDTTVQSGTTYYYTIRAYSGSTLSSFYSKGFAIKYIKAPKISSIKNNLDGLYMTWNKIVGAKGYYVYRKTSNGSWTQIAKTSNLSYKDKKARVNTNYYYTVRAYSGSAISSFYSNTGAVKFLHAPKVSAVQNTVDGTYIKWNRVTGATAYQVLRRSTKGDWKVIAKVSEANYRDTSKLASGATYYYSVKAVNGKITSSMQAGTPIRYLAAPQITVQNAVGSAYVKWNKVTGATAYQVQKRLANGDWKVIATVKGTNYKDTAVKNGTTYYYSIKAINGNTTSSMRSGTAIKYLTAPQVTGVQNAVDAVYIKWNKISGANGYQVQRKSSGGTWEVIATVAETSYRDTAVKSGETYYYTVKAVSGKMTSSMRSGTAISYLAAPSISCVTKATYNGSDVSWNGVEGATEYQVQRKSAEGTWEIIATVTATSYKDISAKTGATYYYTIRAINSNTKSSMRVGVTNGYLAAPTISGVTNVTNGIEITWNEVNGATEYQVQKRLEDGDWEVVAIVTTDTVYKDTAVENDTTYHYAIKAVNYDTESAVSEDVAVRYLEAPTISRATNVTDGIEISWNAVSGATAYQVLRRLEDGDWKVIATITETLYRDITTESGKKYYYAVKAMDGNMLSAPGDDTAVEHLAAPTILNVTNITDGIGIRWSEVNGATLYMLQKRTERGVWEILAVSAETVYTDIAVESGVTYHYSIKAINENTSSATSYDIMITR